MTSTLPSSSNGADSSKEAAPGVMAAPHAPVKDSMPQTATNSQKPGTQSSDSSGKTSQGTSNSSNTPSSAETVPIVGSQEVNCDENSEPEPIDPNVWGVLHPLQPEFIQLEMINDKYTFGRAKDCDYCFDMPSIKKHKNNKLFSKKQFAISRTRSADGCTERIFLDDLGGTNGTFVNGDKVPSKRQRGIRNLDKIGLAYSTCCVFLFIDPKAKTNPELPLTFSKKYILHNSIGKGACGEVFETWTKVGGGRFACKVIGKDRFSLSVNSSNRDAMIEAKLLQQLQHPCIIEVKDVIDSPKNLYIVLEYAAGGELFERIAQGGSLKEPLARLYFYQMLCAVDYLHDNGITHRDLKPENILLMCKNEPTLLKITDFGMSRLVDEQSLMRTLAGTPSYLAPEIIERIRSLTSPGYTKLVDMWSLGVILYVCLVAYPPFSNGRSDTNQDIHDQILSADYNFNHSRWMPISPLAKQLVTHLLKLNASERLNTSQALAHEWLNNNEMRKQAAELMMVSREDANSNAHTVNINLMGDKSLSGGSTSTRKVSTDESERQLSGASTGKLSSHSSIDKTEASKRAHEPSDATATTTKQAKVED